MLLDPDYTGKEEKSHLEQLLKELKEKYDLTGKLSSKSCRVSPVLFHLIINHHSLSWRNAPVCSLFVYVDISTASGPGTSALTVTLGRLPPN